MYLSQGVVLLDEATQPFLDDVGIDLRRRYIGVTQQLLDRAQIRPSFQQMAGKRMAEHMRRDPRRLDSGGSSERLQLLAEALAGQMLRPVAGRE